MVRDVAKSFGSTTVLDGIDLDVPSGSVAGVLGPSGSGKTTLLRVLAGFVTADGGRVELGADTLVADAVHVAPERRRIGVVPQESALFPHLSVGANVGFGLRRGVSRPERDARVAELLELVGLAGRSNADPHEMSGGEQQRVALARALAPHPRLVLLDEPFSALDASLRARLRDDVSAILRAAGCTAVLVTHDQEEVLTVADQVAVMLGGRIAQAAPPRELYAAPATLDVALFVGDSSVVRGEVRGGFVRTALGRSPLAVPTAAGPATAVLRPEQLSLVSLVGGRSGAAGAVVAHTYNGPDGEARVLLDTGEEVAARVDHDTVVTAGDAVRVAVRGPVLAYPSAR